MHATPASTRAHVLVIEAYATLRQMLHVLLDDDGYTIVEPSAGCSSLELLGSSPVPLIVLLDCSSPDRDGLQVLHALAGAAPLVQRHAFLLLREAPGTSHPAQTLALPSGLHVADLAKPFTLADLLKAVGSLAGELRAMDP